MGKGISLLWPSMEMGIAVGVSLLLAVSVASKCFDGEREVLLKFKHNVFDGEDKLRSWGNHSEDCCRDWEGVRCDDATGHVIRIDLTIGGLSAKGGGKCTTSLPLFELRYLRYLDLSYNDELLLNRSISSLIGNNTMLSLQHLNLAWTGIVGNIPETFGNNMPALTYLDLSDNKLEGSIPKTFGNSMPALTYLDLSHNKLEGSIPETFGNNMPALTYLVLSDNKLQGSIPKTFGNSMPALTYLDLFYNKLEGSIPETFGNNMSALTYLDLSANAFEGEIPKFIWNICTLKVLSLASNSLGGNLIISTLCSNHSLQELYLPRNRLTGSFPDLTKFPSLTKLFIGYNLLRGVISEHHLVTLPKLRTLDLSSTNFTFNLTSTWLPPFQLERIFLSSCNLGPRFPNWLRTQVNITIIDISNNAISDSIPSWFWNTTITGFLRVNISNNGIKGKIEIGAHASVSGDVLDMSSNQLEAFGCLIQSTFRNTSGLLVISL
ncbi:unnamed protein product [Cuscuta epithymum]|uniref:Leucine-rich repeat-containing N-terminal plant-type domain-containing protein n=1 Tax=Cuscuta epithymum TaxID=186058 RepID=A0AAV0FMZ5_9ASTE|nr:unnamed protein product [Cuscuta epithymum]